MKQITFIAAFLMMIGHAAYGQQIMQQEPPYIEVNGMADTLIIPDEIYVAITIRERENGKDKITVEQQEKELKEALVNLGIKLEDLTVSNAQADYIRVKWNQKNVVSQSNYELKLTTAEQVGNVFEQLDALKIHSAYIARVTHSRLEEYQREIEILAIKAAKDKATYLLNAIGQKPGTALIVRQDQYNGFNSFKGVQTVYAEEGRYDSANYMQLEDKLGSLEFRKIKLQSTIYVKFKID